jgi:hypothetical protein
MPLSFVHEYLLLLGFKSYTIVFEKSHAVEVHQQVLSFMMPTPNHGFGHPSNMQRFFRLARALLLHLVVAAVAALGGRGADATSPSMLQRSLSFLYFLCSTTYRYEGRLIHGILSSKLSS